MQAKSTFLVGYCGMARGDLALARVLTPFHAMLQSVLVSLACPAFEPCPLVSQTVLFRIVHAMLQIFLVLMLQAVLQHLRLMLQIFLVLMLQAVLLQTEQLMLQTEVQHLRWMLPTVGSLDAPNRPCVDAPKPSHSNPSVQC